MINKIAVIGAGVIGSGWIVRFLAHNKKVIVYDTNPKLRKKVILEVKRAWPFVKKLFNKTERYFKNSVDILVNNSGGPAPKFISEITAKDWEKSLNINFKSAIYSSTIALNKMKKKGWGRIINLTSSTAKEPAKKMCLSNVSRAALASFAKTLSLEVGEFGVTVNTILTGGVLTDRLKNLIKIRIKKSNLKLNQEINKISKNIPVGRIASPDEFIQLIIFLASEKSSYVNGAAIPIDGGTSKSLF